jgi:hypothetical protein
VRYEKELMRDRMSELERENTKLKAINQRLKEEIFGQYKSEEDERSEVERRDQEAEDVLETMRSVRAARIKSGGTRKKVIVKNKRVPRTARIRS